MATDLTDVPKEGEKQGIRTEWLVVESLLFQEKAPQYLTDREWRALERDLVADPLSGRPVAEFPGYFILDWGKLSPLEVLYLVGDEHLILVDIQPGTGLIEIDEADVDGLRKIYEVIKRGMGWAAGRALWEIIKRILGIE